jgi:hypothetical protein
MWERIDTVDGAMCCILAWKICIWNFMLQICIADLGEGRLQHTYLIQSASERGCFQALVK